MAAVQILYVANKGTLHLVWLAQAPRYTSPRSYISGRYAFCNSEAMEAVMSSKEPHHLSIYMIEWYVTSLRYHYSCDDHLSHAVR